MSKTYEFHGKNIDKALEAASNELDIPIEQIKHEVITYGSSGIFGLVGVKKATIKVFIDEQPNINTSINEESLGKEIEENDTVNASKQNDTAVDSSEDKQVSEDVVDHGMVCLQKIIESISNGGKVEAQQKDNRILYSISGGDSGVMIGKRGQTLEAIQYLLEKMVNKKQEKRVRIVVDIEGYLEKRKNNLKQMASKMAEKAKRIKKPVTIGQMNAHDRRIVHIHLKNENGIRTQSIGEGYYRKLMIFPKKAGNHKKR